MTISKLYFQTSTNKHRISIVIWTQKQISTSAIIKKKTKPWNQLFSLYRKQPMKKFTSKKIKMSTFTRYRLMAQLFAVLAFQPSKNKFRKTLDK